METRDKWVIVYLNGRIDSYNYEIIAEKLDLLIKVGKKKLAVHLGEVNFLSLTIVRFLVSLAHRLHQNEGRLSLLKTSSKISHQFDIFGSNKNIHFIESEGDLD